MSQEGDLDRAALLALTPDRYLVGGFLGSHGQTRQELLSVYATAAAIQLEAAQISPQELATTLEALRQVLPLHRGAPGERLRAAIAEAPRRSRG